MGKKCETNAKITNDILGMLKREVSKKVDREVQKDVERLIEIETKENQQNAPTSTSLN